MQPNTQPSRLLTTVQLAEMLATSASNVNRMAAEGRIPGYPLGTGRRRREWRFVLAEVLAALRDSQDRSARECA